MPKSIASPRHELLRNFLIAEREKAKLTQTDVAKRLKRYQSFVARIENGQKVVDVVELIDLARAIGFDPRKAVKALMD